MKNARIARVEDARRCIRHLVVELGKDESTEVLKILGVSMAHILHLIGT